MLLWLKEMCECYTSISQWFSTGVVLHTRGYLDIFQNILAVTAGEVGDGGRCATGIYWEEVRGAAKHLRMKRSTLASQEIIIWPKMSIIIVPRLRNLDLR